MADFAPDIFKTLRWDLLQRFLETRFDVLCEYLADEEDGSSPYTFREDAEAMIATVRQCSRWARIPARSRWVIAGLVLKARSMWQEEGAELPAVRRYLATRVPVEHLAVALEESFRGAPMELLEGLGGVSEDGLTPLEAVGDGSSEGPVVVPAATPEAGWTIPPAPLPETQED